MHQPLRRRNQHVKALRLRAQRVAVGHVLGEQVDAPRLGLSQSLELGPRLLGKLTDGREEGWERQKKGEKNKEKKKKRKKKEKKKQGRRLVRQKR